MTELVLRDEVYEVVGAAMEVYWQLGRGYLEPIYQEAFEVELSRRRIPFEPKRELTIVYKGQPLEKKYVPDLICFGQIVVELKALERLSGVEQSQLLNYLKMTRMRVGLLINFGSRVRLEWKRYVM
jgi:GxxExxY protein